MNLQFLQLIDTENAEFEWIRITQKEFSSNKSYFNQLKIRFGVFFGNENILRCGGRLQFSDLPENSKDSILLPNSHISLISSKHYSHIFKQNMVELKRHYFTSSFKVLDY